MNSELITSIYDKHLEITYDSKVINSSTGPVRIKLKGKIFCPILNQKINSLVCAKLMDKEGWPRCVDKNVCEKAANCFIYKSIIKHMEKNKNGHKTESKNA
jgi:hypothetical protein